MTITGTITYLVRHVDRTGHACATGTMQTDTDTVPIYVSSGPYREYGHLLAEDEPVVVYGAYGGDVFMVTRVEPKE